MNLLGVPTHLFRGPPAAVAETIRAQGLTCVQLTPNFPGLAFRDPGQITPERCRLAAAPFLDAGLCVACVGGSAHLLDPDLERRHRGVLRLHALLRHARDFGAAHVLTETGSLNPESPWQPYPANRSPEAWEELRLLVAEALRVAADQGVTLLLKPGPAHVVATAADALRLRQELAHPALGFVLDPAVELAETPPAAWPAALERLFAQLGDAAHLLHAKDLRLVDGAVTLPHAGRGLIDYALVARLLRRCPRAVPIILEHLRPADVAEARAYLEQCLRAADA